MIFTIPFDGERNNVTIPAITTVDIKGLLKNQHIIHTYRTVPDNELINPKYENVVDIPESEIKSGSRYYGSIYAGIVPSDCINVEILVFPGLNKHTNFSHLG